MVINEVVIVVIIGGTELEEYVAKETQIDKLINGKDHIVVIYNQKNCQFPFFLTLFKCQLIRCENTGNHQESKAR